ncbi:hypothetical protein [Massilia cavernae]
MALTPCSRAMRATEAPGSSDSATNGALELQRMLAVVAARMEMCP